MTKCKNVLLLSNLISANYSIIEYAADFCKHYNYKLHIHHVTESSHPVFGVVSTILY